MMDMVHVSLCVLQHQIFIDTCSDLYLAPERRHCIPHSPFTITTDLARLMARAM
jgi:hypothetical protein